jgi:hypothetical protein
VALKNHIAIVLDRSGSMHSIRAETIKSFNDTVETIREQSQESGQETTVSLIVFSNHAKIVFFNADVRTLKPLTPRDYVPDGLTALFDGVGLCIDSFRNLPDAKDKDVSFLVITITDGDENNSTQYSASKVVQMLKETQSTDRWSFAFQLPAGRRDHFSQKYGVPSDNIREWEATKVGTQTAAVATTQGLTNFYRARSLGKMSVRNFYEMTTDMSRVDVKTVRSKLDDISDRFTILEVPKEMAIKEFVEEKTGRVYVIGSAYYQLMKTEQVQETKDVLIMEKGKKAVWGGREARDLIKLPHDGTAKVYPGNHSNYDIFVQSTSVNRKLVRGTRVLIDNTIKRDLMPTWDHTAVAR